jgi:hypothetical protein
LILGGGWVVDDDAPSVDQFDVSTPFSRPRGIVVMTTSSFIFNVFGNIRRY